jgi:hypothetical protein
MHDIVEKQPIRPSPSDLLVPCLYDDRPMATANLTPASEVGLALVAQATAIASLPAFDGGGVPRLFPPLFVPRARSRASNLATKALAFPISYLDTKWCNPNYLLLQG